MDIKIETGRDLDKLIDALEEQIVDAMIYHRLLCDIASSRIDNIRAFSQSNTFWNLTLDALQDAKIIRLCRVYDQTNSSISLINLLHTIKLNLHLFEEHDFRDRLKKSEFVDSLSQTNRIPSMKELEDDIKYVSTSNPLVYKLIIWRNNIIAHRGAKVSLGKIKVLEDNLLSPTEVENLLDTSFAIYSRYSRLYRVSTYSSSLQIVGHDDYKSLLKLINLGLDKLDEDIYRDQNN